MLVIDGGIVFGSGYCGRVRAWRLLFMVGWCVYLDIVVGVRFVFGF